MLRFIVFSLALCLFRPSFAADRPNVLFILADDLAWSDLGCYGHPWHETPHLDRLASEGMRFTQAYAPAPICSASRASFLTGKTPARLHFEFVTKGEPGRQPHIPGQKLLAPPYTMNLRLEEETIADCLQAAGYETAFFGKWHLNAHHNGYLGWSPEFGPPQQGFGVAREDFGSHPYSYRKQGRPEPVVEEGKYLEDSMTDGVIEFLNRKHATPFFAMASYFYVHTPVETPYHWLLKKYELKVPRESPNRQKRIRYAAFLETFDHYIGKLLSGLDRAGHREDTLVVFYSDNGGDPDYTANGPLRGSKWNLYEGGIRVPMLVRWPKHVQPGSTCDQPVIGYDLFPTLKALAGGGASQVDGRDISQLFSNPQLEMHRPLYWHFPYYHPEKGYNEAIPDIGRDDFMKSQTRPHSAIRVGKYKLIHFDEDNTIELYDLQADIHEANDLSETSREVARFLSQQLNQYLYRNESGAHARRAVPVPIDSERN